MIPAPLFLLFKIADNHPNPSLSDSIWHPLAMPSILPTRATMHLLHAFVLVSKESIIAVAKPVSRPMLPALEKLLNTFQHTVPTWPIAANTNATFRPVIVRMWLVNVQSHTFRTFMSRCFSGRKALLLINCDRSCGACNTAHRNNNATTMTDYNGN